MSLSRGESMAKKAEESTVRVQPIRVDPHFKHEVMEEPGGETLNVCFQCGTCTSSCPVARYTNSYRPRQILRMAQLGLSEKIFSSGTLWLCAACFTCTDRCPQNVEVTSVLRVLRNMAVKKGFIPPVFKELGSSVSETGLAYKIPALRLSKREEQGLPPLPKANLEQVKKILEATGLSKAIGSKGAGEA